MYFKHLLLSLMLATSNAAGQQAPVFDVPALNSPDSISLSQFSGEVVVIDFWASWCTPCRKTLPQYQRWFEAGQVAVITVNLDEEVADAEAMITKLGLTLPVAHDPDKSVARAYGVYGLPTAFVVDPGGVLIRRFDGYTAAGHAALEDFLQALREGDGKEAVRRF